MMNPIWLISLLGSYNSITRSKSSHKENLKGMRHAESGLLAPAGVEGCRHMVGRTRASCGVRSGSESLNPLHRYSFSREYPESGGFQGADRSLSVSWSRSFSFTLFLFIYPCASFHSHHSRPRN